MPSTVVHLALAGMIAASLLRTSFDRKALFVVFALVALPDLDSFVALVSTAGHRTVGHTFLLPITGALLLGYDTLVRESSLVRERWGRWGVDVGWVGLFSMAFAGIGLDFIEAGVNPLWPLHDQFYVLDGKIELSDQRGIIQTFVDLSPEPESGGGGGSPGPERLGSSQEVNMSTGVDPDPDGSEADPERIFPVVRAGWELLVLVTGSLVTAVRLRVE